MSGAGDATQRLRPDERPDDYVDFYSRIGAAQLEEAYYGRHGYAVARHHLLLGVLTAHARRGDQLLDVGCASGYYSVRYAQRGGRARGVDVAPASVAFAARRASDAGVQARCAFRTGDLRELDVPDASVDVVLATEVLEHVREQREALAELARVLRPGGTLVVSVPGALDALPARARIAHREAPSAEQAGVELERLGSNAALAAAGIAHDPYFHDAFTVPQLRAMLPPSLAVVRACSLLFVPPRALSYGFLVVEAVMRRLPRQVTATAPPSRTPAGDMPLPIPAAYAEAQALMVWTRWMWRLPIVRHAGVGVLLVARRR